MYSIIEGIINVMFALLIDQLAWLMVYHIIAATPPVIADIISDILRSFKLYKAGIKSGIRITADVSLDNNKANPKALLNHKFIFFLVIDSQNSNKNKHWTGSWVDIRYQLSQPNPKNINHKLVSTAAKWLRDTL